MVVALMDQYRCRCPLVGGGLRLCATAQIGGGAVTTTRVAEPPFDVHHCAGKHCMTARSAAGVAAVELAIPDSPTSDANGESSKKPDFPGDSVHKFGYNA
jgi:hypothetical protein